MNHWERTLGHYLFKENKDLKNTAYIKLIQLHIQHKNSDN